MDNISNSEKADELLAVARAYGLDGTMTDDDHWYPGYDAWLELDDFIIEHGVIPTEWQKSIGGY